jgi:phage gp45-like
MGGLQPGETAIYAVDGTRVHCKIGGIVEIIAATQVIITAPNGVEITGDVTITGNLTTSANVTGGTGASGSFTSPLGQTITVRDGVITNIF